MTNDNLNKIIKDTKLSHHKDELLALATQEIHDLRHEIRMLQEQQAQEQTNMQKMQDYVAHVVSSPQHDRESTKYIPPPV